MCWLGLEQPIQDKGISLGMPRHERQLYAQGMAF